MQSTCEFHAYKGLEHLVDFGIQGGPGAHPMWIQRDKDIYINIHMHKEWVHICRSTHMKDEYICIHIHMHTLVVYKK
jgi:hypothetical protein